MIIDAAAENGAKRSLFSQLPGPDDAGIVRLRVVADYRFRPYAPCCDHPHMSPKLSSCSSVYGP